jgi:hypothetical protein
MGSFILAKRFQLSLCQAPTVLFLSSDNILIGVTVVITTALIAQGRHASCAAVLQFLAAQHQHQLMPSPHRLCF